MRKQWHKWSLHRLCKISKFGNTLAIGTDVFSIHNSCHINPCGFLNDERERFDQSAPFIV